MEAAQDELENKIACEKLAKPRITEEQLRFFLEKFRKMDVTNQAQRKMLIDTFVNAIFLYDDKVVLTYNFHEGTETISFEELQKVTEAGASGSDLVSSTAPNLKNRPVQSFGSAQDGFLSKFYQAIRRSFPNSAFLFFHHIWKAESPRG